MYLKFVLTMFYVKIKKINNNSLRKNENLNLKNNVSDVKNFKTSFY